MKSLLAILLLCVAVSAKAANGLTIGTLTLIPTFECVSVQAAFNGDDNSNARGLIEYKLSSSGTWLGTFTNYLDRFATFDGGANPHSNECRASLVGLIPNTAYDVRITWFDADGVSGSNPASTSTTTRNPIPTLGGTTIYVDSAAGGGGDGTSGTPYNTIAAAVSAAVAGDTVKLKGTFGTTTITKSGTTGAWIKFEQWNAPLTIGGSTDSLILSGSNLWFYNFTVAASTRHGVSIASASSYIILDSLAFENVATGTPAFGAAGVNVMQLASYITVRSNSINTDSAALGDDSHGNIAGAVYFEADGNDGGGHVVADNVITGKFRDGIGGGGNYYGDGPVANSDICRNYLSGMLDDGIECEGNNRNIRIWGNFVTNTTGQAGMGLAGTGQGPLYFFRNVVRTENGILGLKFGNADPGPVYVFHNTISVLGYAPLADGFSDAGGGGDVSYRRLFRNNIIIAGRYNMYQAGTSPNRLNSYDYDFFTVVNYMADQWNYADTYQTFAAFQSGTGEEANGLSGNPLFNTGNFTLSSASPARDAGLVIPNFNEGLPDMGAFEFVPLPRSTRGGFVTSGGKVSR